MSSIYCLVPNAYFLASNHDPWLRYLYGGGHKGEAYARLVVDPGQDSSGNPIATEVTDKIANYGGYGLTRQAYGIDQE